MRAGQKCFCLADEDRQGLDFSRSPSSDSMSSCTRSMVSEDVSHKQEPQTPPSSSDGGLFTLSRSPPIVRGRSSHHSSKRNRLTDFYPARLCSQRLNEALDREPSVASPDVLDAVTKSLEDVRVHRMAYRLGESYHTGSFRSACQVKAREVNCTFPGGSATLDRTACPDRCALEESPVIFRLVEDPLLG